MKAFRSHNGRFSRDLDTCVQTHIVRNAGERATTMGVAFARSVDVRPIIRKVVAK